MSNLKTHHQSTLDARVAPTCLQAARCRRAPTQLLVSSSKIERQTCILFGTRLTDTSLEDASRLLLERVRSGDKTTVAFLNAHCVNVLNRDARYRDAVTQCDILFADGSGMRIAARAKGRRLQDNVNGTDLFPVLCSQAAATGVGLFLLGGSDGVSAAAGSAMKSKYPNLTISGTSNGYFDNPVDENNVVEKINASKASIVLVGMGVPLQELWIQRNRDRLSAEVVIGVGGLFDYFSGRLPRAPKPIRSAGFEWAWRLALEPQRLAHRYLIGNVEFLWRVLTQSIQDRFARTQSGI